jgi:hypothetical protein
MGTGQPTYPVNMGDTDKVVDTSAGVGDAGKLIKLDAAGRLGTGLAPTTPSGDNDVASKGYVDGLATTFATAGTNTVTKTQANGVGAYSLSVDMGDESFENFEIFYNVNVINHDSTQDRQRYASGRLVGKIGGDVLNMYTTNEANQDAVALVELAWTPGTVTIETTLPVFTSTSAGNVLTLTITSITRSTSSILINFTVAITGSITNWTTTITPRYIIVT